MINVDPRLPHNLFEYILLQEMLTTHFSTHFI